MTADRLRDNLSLLGLSSKEIEVYLTILDHGTATVSRVVEDSEVSQRHVYQMCERLHDRGLVVLNDHVRPSVVRAQSPDSAVRHIEDHLGELEADIEGALAGKEVSDLEVELIKSAQTLEKRWRRYIESAGDEVFVCVPASVFDRFRDALADAVDRGCLVYVLLTEPGLASVGESDVAGRASLARRWEYEPRPLLTIDRERVVLDEPKLLINGPAAGSAISLSRSAVAANLFNTYVSNFWAIGTETVRCEPVSLPASFARLRSAVVHATLHEQTGQSLTATLTARENDSGRIVEMTDVPVVGIRQGLLEPFTNEFPIENSLRVEYEGEVVSVGGAGSTIEPYEALDVRLDAAE